jgi:hypothetical protein
VENDQKFGNPKPQPSRKKRVGVFGGSSNAKPVTVKFIITPFQVMVARIFL